MVSLQVSENSQWQDKDRGDKEQSPRLVRRDKAYRGIRSPRDSYADGVRLSPKSI